MEQTQKRRRPRHWGSRIFIFAVLALLVFGIVMLARTISLQLTWRDFELSFAACVYDVGAEDGYLKATSETETVRVDPANATNIFKLIQTGRCTKSARARSPERPITLEFSDGGYAVLSLCDGRSHIDFTDPNGERWQLYLGCDYSKLEWLLSVEGAAIENAPWTD